MHRVGARGCPRLDLRVAWARLALALILIFRQNQPQFRPILRKHTGKPPHQSTPPINPVAPIPIFRQNQPESVRFRGSARHPQPDIHPLSSSFSDRISPFMSDFEEAHRQTSPPIDPANQPGRPHPHFQTKPAQICPIPGKHPGKPPHQSSPPINPVASIPISDKTGPFMSDFEEGRNEDKKGIVRKR